MKLDCVGHPGPHDLRLLGQLGGTDMTLYTMATVALVHAFTGNQTPDNEARANLALDVLDRANNGEPQVTDGEATALIAAVESGREYMIANNYADDESFPEDAAVARLFEAGYHVNICWSGR